jgi:Flp pilus assembly protein TadG
MMKTELRSTATAQSSGRRFLRRLLWKSQKEEGTQLIELALVLPVFLYLLVGAVDFGRAFYLATEVASAAEAGAAYGVSSPTDTAGMKSAAMLNATDIRGFSPVATYGSECTDGSALALQTSTPPTCTSGLVQFVEVDASTTYSPLLHFPGVPTSLPIASKARMRASF